MKQPDFSKLKEKALKEVGLAKLQMITEYRDALAYEICIQQHSVEGYDFEFHEFSLFAYRNKEDKKYRITNNLGYDSDEVDVIEFRKFDDTLDYDKASDFVRIYPFKPTYDIEKDILQYNVLLDNFLKESKRIL